MGERDERAGTSPQGAPAGVLFGRRLHPGRHLPAHGGLDPTHVVLVGDSVWDVEAAARLDIPCIGLTWGGTGEAELSKAGAGAVYEDPAALLAALDDSPVASLR